MSIRDIARKILDTSENHINAAGFSQEPNEAAYTLEDKSFKIFRVVGYIPFIGIIPGVSNIIKARWIAKSEIESTSTVVKLGIRGTLECLGLGLICLPADIVCHIADWSKHHKPKV